jgi:Zn-dependent protease/predicted transcriptional regulator
VLRNSFRLFTIGGIEVGVHYSWLIVFALVTWSLSTLELPREPELRNLPRLELWVLGAITSVLLFASVLIHELAHSFVARARGLQATSITLFIFGGVSNLAGDAKSATTEFLIAIVGPLTSFILAAIAYAVAAFVNEPRVDVVARYLFSINLLLGLFNLIPGFPLDGGRVLRAILWGSTGSQRKATEWAGLGGKLVAYGMFGVGILMVLDGNLVGGIWLAAIAWFLYSAASSSVQQIVFETRLRKVRAGDVVRPDEMTVQPGISVAELVDTYLLPGNRRAVPVTDNGRLVGIVTVSDVQRVPHEVRNKVSVAEIMGGRDGMVSVRVDQPVQDAVEILAERDLEQVPVLDGGRVVGLLTRGDVMRQLQLREALDA